MGSSAKIYFLLGYMALVSVHLSVNAQHRADSLWAFIEKAPHDSIRARHLLELSDTYRSSDPDSVLILTDRALSLLQSKGMPRLEASAWLRKGDMQALQTEFDSAVASYRQAYILYSALRDSVAQASVLQKIGISYSNQGDFGKAIQIYKRSLAMLGAQKADTKPYALILLSIGRVHMRQGDALEALENFLQALVVFEKENSERDIGIVTLNIGIVYSNLQDYKESLRYHEQSLKVFETLQDKRFIAISSNSISRVMLETGDLEKALVLANRSLQLSLDIQDNINLLYSYDNIGNVYLKQGELAKAVKTFRQALDVQGSQENEAFPRVCANLSKAYLQSGDLANALLTAQKANTVASKTGDKASLRDSYWVMYETYKRQNKPVEALRYHEQYHLYRDSLASLEEAKELANLQTRQAIEQKQQEIDLLERRRQLDQEYSDRQEKITIGLSVGIVLLIGISTALFQSRKRLTLLNRMLMEQQRNNQSKQAAILRQNEEIFQQKERIAEQAAELEQLTQRQNQLLAIVSHDLRGPISQLDASLQLLDQEVLSDEEFRMIIRSVQLGTASLGETMNNLLLWAYSQFGDKADAEMKSERVELLQTAKAVCDLLSGMANAKQIHLLNEIPIHLFVWADPRHVSFILRNLVSNAIKFTPEMGKITIEAFPKETMVMLKVSDTGVGIPDHRLAGLFAKGKLDSQRGTRGEKGTGLGLVLCKEMAERNGGSLEIHSEMGKGTVVQIWLPTLSYSTH